MTALAMRGLVTAWLLLISLLPVRAAADACSPLFTAPSPHLSADRCDVQSARALLRHQVPPACQLAAKKGEAKQSVDRLILISAERSSANCGKERQQLAQYAVCLLRPPQQAKQFLRGLDSDWLGSSWNWNLFIASECLHALLDSGDKQVIDSALRQLTQLDNHYYAEVRGELLAQVASHAGPELDDQLAPILQMAQDGRWLGRDRLRSLLCLRRPVVSTALREACVERPENTEVRVEYETKRRVRRRLLGLRLGLSAMSIAIAGMQLGLTAHYKNQAPGRAMATFGGITSGLLVIPDLMMIFDPPGNQSFESYFFKLPGGIANLMILPSLLLLMLPVGAAGGAAYATSESPTGAIVSSALSASFSLASALALTWIF